MERVIFAVTAIVLYLLSHRILGLIQHNLGHTLEQCSLAFSSICWPKV